MKTLFMVALAFVLGGAGMIVFLSQFTASVITFKKKAKV